MTPAGATIRRLMPIPDGPQRIARLERELTTQPPGEVAVLLAGLLELCLEGPGRELWLCFAHSVSKRSFDYLWTRAVYEASHDLGTDLLGTILLAGDEPAESAGEGSFAPPDVTLEGLTLGHRKALARTAAVDVLEKLATDAEPAVIQIWLTNLRLTERLVVRLCAMRPNRAGVLQAVACDWKWSRREAVRKALAANPYTAARIAAVLLPSLPLADVRGIAGDARLDRRVNEVACRLARRPGAPERPPRGTRP